MNKLLIFTALFFSAAGHAQWAPRDAVQQLRETARFRSVILIGTADSGARCRASLQVGDEFDNYFYVSLKDTDGHGASMPIALTPISSNSIIASDYVSLEEGDVTNPRRAGQNRFAKLTGIKSVNGVTYPEEISVGYTQMEPEVQNYEFRCYSLTPATN